MKLKSKGLKLRNQGSAVSLTGMLLGLTLLSITCAGCVHKDIVLYPLEHDFYKISGGGWFMSDFYLCNVMGVKVQGVNCDEVKTNE